MWSVVSPDQTEPLCRSGRDNELEMSVCLLDGRDVYLLFSIQVKFLKDDIIIMWSREDLSIVINWCVHFHNTRINPWAMYLLWIKRLGTAINNYY